MEQSCFHVSCISVSLIVLNIGTKMSTGFKTKGQPQDQFLSIRGQNQND